jgi:hypothetical protein
MIWAVDDATALMIGSSTSAGKPIDTRRVFMAIINSYAETSAWGAACVFTTGSMPVLTSSDDQQRRFG